MTRVYICCEGQTEEMFVREVLRQYISLNADVYAVPIVLETKHTLHKKYRGGLLRYKKAKAEISRLCAGHPNEYVTTMVDFYAFPKDAPGMDKKQEIVDVYKKVEYVEAEIAKDIGHRNFIPNLMLHEFESLLFVEPDLLKQYYQHDDSIEMLCRVRDSFETPEHIDDGKDTAPSKRIIAAIPEYDKIVAGSLVSMDTSIDRIREECRHFSEWVDKLCSLGI